MQEWDPIGVVDAPEAQDEYDSYIPEIARLIAQNGRVDEIARVLVSAERDMNMESNAERALSVAKKLLNISSNFENKHF